MMDPYAAIPQIDSLLNEPAVTEWFADLSRPIVVRIAREVVDEVRRSIVPDGEPPQRQDIVDALLDRCRRFGQRRLCRVINATGVVVHTNLGRSPIDPCVWEDAEATNTGYSNLEFDLSTGKRGPRGGIVGDLLSEFTGAETGLVVNNCAAAVYLMLTAFASGGEVIVSRGEQVQIGGGFRIPDILRASGAELVEVGTTNITVAEDYAEAITERTVMALIVHRSNFRISGFTRSPGVGEIRKALPESILVAVDQGSGTTSEGLDGETSVRSYIESGADLVSFSGDKILGGPQAGCIVGRQALIERLSRHPLMRAFRPGKTVYSLLEAHLIRRLNGEEVSIVASKLAGDPSRIRRRCLRLRRTLGADFTAVVPSAMVVGGGSAPGTTVASWSIRLNSHRPAAEIAASLRNGRIPIITTISNGAVELNLGTVDDADVPWIEKALASLTE